MYEDVPGTFENSQVGCKTKHAAPSILDYATHLPVSGTVPPVLSRHSMYFLVPSFNKTPISW